VILKITEINDAKMIRVMRLVQVSQKLFTILLSLKVTIVAKIIIIIISK